MDSHYKGTLVSNDGAITLEWSADEVRYFGMWRCWGG